MRATICTYRLVGATVVGAALWAVGCQETATRDDVTEAERELREQQQEARQEIRGEQREVAEEAGELKTQQEQLADAGARDEFVKAAEQKLADAEARIGQLEQQAESADGANKEAMDQQLENLRSQHDRAEEALGELKSAELSDWQIHQQGVRTAMQNLDAGLSTIR